MNTGTKVKICGLSRLVDIEAVNIAMPDYIGFVFAPQSKRCVTFEQAAKLKEKLYPEITAVGVFVNENPETILTLAEQKIIDMIQLHGSEDEQYIEKLKSKTAKPIIKALTVGETESTHADYLLFDNPQAGSGKVWNWGAARANKPFFLAGGIDIQNVGAAIDEVKPFAVDISSGVETGGLKDREKIISIVKAVKYGK